MPLTFGMYGLDDGGGGGGGEDQSSPFGLLGSVMRMKSQLELMRERQLINEKRRRDLDDDTAIDEALRSNPGDDGAPNLDKAIAHLQSQGRGSAAIGLQTRVFEWNKNRAEGIKSQTESQLKKLELASRMGQGITDDTSFRRIVPQIGKVLGPDVQKMFGESYDPAVVDSVRNEGMSNTDYLKKQNDVFERGIKAMEMANTAIKNGQEWQKALPKLESEWTNIASGQLSLARNKDEWANGLNMLMGGMQGLPIDVRTKVLSQFDPEFTPQSAERARLMGLTQNERSEEGARNRAHNLEERKFAESKAADVKLSDDAVNMLALSFAKGAPLPAFGMGQHAANDRKEVFNRAAKMYNNLPLAEQIAAFQANKSSLTQMQPMYDKLVAFENTAKANLSPFLEAAGKIIDTGSPWLNQPLRKFDERILGNPEMAAYKMAARVVLPEFSRIISNPNLTGVLSDTARAELEEAMKGDYSVPMIYKAVGVLLKDANNRTTWQLAQINEIKKRIAAPPPSAVATPQTAGTPGARGGIGDATPSPFGQAAAKTATGLPANYEGVVVQGGVKYKIKTDAQGNIIGTPTVVQ